MTRLSTLAILIALFSVTFSNLGYSQITDPCSTSEGQPSFTFSPAPDNNTYEPGQVVEICFTVTYIDAENSSNWIHGVLFDNWPQAYDMSTFSFTVNSNCGNDNFWTWMPNGVFPVGNQGCPGPTEMGFFYDSNSDGNPGNNWGVPPCANAEYTFCIEVALIAGPNNAFDNSSLIPDISVSGDGDTGSWGIEGCGGACNPEPPGGVDLVLDACDAVSGDSPGEVSICENGIMNLNDLLIGEDAGGTWDGPAGSAANGTATAMFDPLDAINWPPGDYTYTVLGTDNCVSSSTITMVYNDWGYIGTILKCVTQPPFDILDEISTPPPAGYEWTDPNGDVVPGGIVNPAAAVTGTYTYTFLDVNNCPTVALVYIGVGQAPSTGCPTEVSVCNLDESFNLFQTMGCDPQSGGIWIEYDVNWDYVDFHDEYNYYFDPGVGSSGYWVYGQISTGCFPQVYSYDTLTVTVNEPAIVGVTTTTEICIADTPIDFTILLDGNPDPGYYWQNQGGNEQVMPFTATSDTSGLWIYVGGVDLCQNSASLFLTVHPDTADAGVDPLPITICESDPPFSLYEELGWTVSDGNGEWDGPDSTGTWSGPGGFTGDVNTQFDPSLYGTGQYTYTVVGEGDCIIDESIFDITVTDQMDAGTDPPIIEVCGDDTSVYPLISELNGTPDAGGTWTPADQFIPANNAVGSYTFYYDIGSGNCADQSQVTFNVNEVPVAGLDGSITVCESATSLTLITVLGGIPDAGGDWYGPNGEVPSGTIDPSPATAGDYVYYVDNAVCGTYSATATVIVDPTPFVGNDVSATTCEGITLDMCAELESGYQTGGTWTFLGNPHPSCTFDPAVDAPGVYTYTAGSGGCTNSVEVTVSITPMPNPGTDNTITICINGSPIDMFPYLGGADTPGTWSNGTNMFDPQYDAAGVYTYTVPGSANCPDASADITVNIEGEMTATSVVETCATDQLTYTISFTATGTAPFSYTGSTPEASTSDFENTGIFTSAAITQGTAYNITFEDASACNSINYSGLVNCACPLTATISGDADICEGACSDLTINFTNGTAPYSFSYFDGLDPVDVTGINTNTYTINVCPAATTVYTLISVEGALCEGTVNGSATINVDAEPFAGTDFVTTVCSSDATLNLIDLLDSNGPADGAGTWSSGLTGGALGTFTPGTTAAGTYTYTASNGACPNDQATVTIDYFNDITVSTETTTCNASFTQYTVSFQISGGDNTSYNVTGTGDPGSIDGSGVFTSGLITTGTNYSFTITDDNNCEQIIIAGNSPNCDCPVTATISGSTTICQGETTDITITADNGDGDYTLIYNEGGIPQPALTGDSPWTISVNPSVTTTYSLVSVVDGNCTGTANGSVTVTVDNPVNAGTSTSFTTCADEASINLLSLLGPGTTATGSWTPALDGTPNGIFDPSSDNSGIYTYDVDGGGTCPDASATVDVEVFDLITVDSYTTCLLNNTEYTVTIEISGGDGQYYIDGNLVGSTWTSDAIAEGTTYSYSVEDGNACNIEVVSGASPVCDCPASATISGTTAICEGESAELTIIITGDGPFDFIYNNGISDVPVNNVSSPHVLTVNPAGTTTYTLVSMEDANCAGPVSGSALVTVNSAPVVSTETITCNSTGEFYTVSFTITGGTGSYTIEDTENETTSTSGSNYTSGQIASGTPYTFIIDDANNCDPVNLSGSNTCVCLSDAGSMGTTPLDICANTSGTAVFNNDAFLDGNDVQKFVLHDGTANSLGNILGWYNSPTITYNTEFVYDQTYFLSSVVGNSAPGSTVDTDDICFSVSNGTPVTFREIPTAIISGGGWVCESEESTITVEFSGPGPWDYTYEVDYNYETDGFSNSSINTFNSVQPGIYAITEISNDYCEGTASGMAEINNFTTPTATLSGPETICVGSSLNPIVNLTGTGPWSLEYAVNGETQDPLSSNSAYVDLNVEEGLYSLLSVSDNNCPGIVSGALDVETPMPPTAIITGGGVVCEGEEAEFSLNLTGDGPWTVQYSVNGLPQSPISVDESEYTFSSEMNGEYIILNVVDENCSGEVLQSFSNLVVNPIPTATLETSSPSICAGQELEVNFEFEGNGPFNVDYVVNGDTMTWSNVGNVINQTYTPDQEMVIELLYIEDNSSPQCSNQLDISTYVGLFNLPNAPQLMDDTICADSGPIHIGANGSSSLTYLWYPATNLSEPTSPNPIATLTNETSNFVTYQYTLTSSNGECTLSDTVNVTLDPGPNVRFEYNPTKVTTEESKVKFYNFTGSEDFEYIWEFGNLGTSTEFEPTFTFPEDVAATYVINLMAIDPATGCISERSKTINVLPELLIYIPNAFTPDGDGLNDRFFPVLRNVDPSEYEFTIFNRFGEVVFQTTEIDEPWNGSDMSGEYFVHAGVYVWKIVTKNKLTLEEIELDGRVTVVR